MEDDDLDRAFDQLDQSFKDLDRALREAFGGVSTGPLQGVSTVLNGFCRSFAEIVKVQTTLTQRINPFTREKRS